MFTKPVFERLTAHSKPPSLRTTLLIVGGLFAMAVVAAGLWVAATPGLIIEAAGVEILRNEPLLNSPNAKALQLGQGRGDIYGPANGLSTAVTLLLVILMPAALTSAAILTAKETQSEGYVLQHLTNLPPGAVIDGLLGTALFRWRVPLALAIAAIPLLVVLPYQKDQGLTRYGCLILAAPEDVPSVTRDFPAPCVDPHDPRLLWRAMSVVPRTTSLVGGVLLAAALGVSVTLWLRNPIVVIAAIIFFLVAVLAVLTLLGPAIGSVFSSCASIYPCPRVEAWSPATILLGWLLAALPYGLAWGAARLGRRWV